MVSRLHTHGKDQPAMWNSEKQTTAAGIAILPAAVATMKCPPLFDRDTQAHRGVGFAEVSETGDIPEIIGNDRGSTRRSDPQSGARAGGCGYVQTHCPPRGARPGEMPAAGR